MKRLIAIILLITIWTVSIGACRREHIPQNNAINLEAHGFELINTTAYIVGHHTANGEPVHPGGCACSLDHIGDIAILYTTSGHFLGYYQTQYDTRNRLDEANRRQSLCQVDKGGRIMKVLARVMSSIGFVLILLGGAGMDSASLVMPIVMILVGIVMMWNGMALEGEYA